MIGDTGSLLDRGRSAPASQQTPARDQPFSSNGEWVERRQNPADRRSSLLTLTDDGRRLVAAAEGTFSERLAELIADTPDAPPITAAAGALARLRSVLEHDQIGTPTG